MTIAPPHRVAVLRAWAEPGLAIARCTTAVAIFAIAACSSKSDSQPAPQPPTIPSDASVDGITAIGGFDPGHLDDVEPTGTPQRPAKRPGRPIEVTLRSSPTGARVQVDGIVIGLTPTMWIGETGAEREFTFTLEGHALARYKFWPITSGTVHARLDPVTNSSDAGARPVAPPSHVPPPTTMLSPDAGVPKVVPPPIDAALAMPSADAATMVAPPIDASTATPQGIGPQP